MHLLSEIPGHFFPGIPDPRAAQVFAVASQLQWSARQPADQIRSLQMRQFHTLALHAHRQSKFWRKRLEEAGFDPAAKTFDAGLLARLPPLTRQQMQQGAEDMRAYPGSAKWGEIGVFQTSGSTGQFLRVEKTSIISVVYDGITFIDHLWNRRDFSQKAAVIRKEVKGTTTQSWSRETANLVRTGPMAQLNPVGMDMLDVLRWVEKERPTYITTWPSILREISYLKLRHGGPPLPIRQAITFGEMVTDECRDVIKRAFGATVSDRYSTEEAGYIALQCHRCNKYHPIPPVIVEIVDDNHRQVAPGQSGRVLVTILHSFPMPLIRYEVGDYAVAGTGCECGRSWPVIDRILGRERSIVQFPDGTKRFVPIDGLDWTDIAPINQWQFRQEEPTRIKLFVSAARPLNEAEMARLHGLTVDLFSNAFAIEVEQVEKVPSLPSGKRPEFVRAF